MVQQSRNTQVREIDYIKLLFHCIKRWYWFAIMVILSIGGALFYLARQNKVYQVGATIMIRSNENRGTTQGDMMQVMGFHLNKRVEDEIQIIKSFAIMEQAVRSLNLQTEYRKKNGMRWVGQYPNSDIVVSYPNGGIESIRSSIFINIERTENDYIVNVRHGEQESKIHVSTLAEPIESCVGPISFLEVKPLKAGDKMAITTAPISSCANAYRSALNCFPVERESNVISITMNSDIPARSCDIISKVIELYNMDAVIDKNIMATNTANFINERLAVVTMELDTVEQAVEDYMQANDLNDLSSEVQLALHTMTDYQKQLVNIETQINLLTYVEEYLNNEQNAQNVIPSNLGIQDASLLKMMQDYNVLALDRMRFSRSATEQSPLFQQTDERMNVLRENILLSIANIKQGLNITKQDISRQDRQLTNALRNAPNKERRYVEIKRQQQIKEELYIYLYQKREENALTLASTVMPAKIIDEPMTTGAISPREKRILLIALLLGLGIPAGIIFLQEYLNDEIQDKRDYESIVKAPFLGEIMQGHSDEAVVVTTHNNSAHAEMFRNIRTNLRFMLPDQQSYVLLVTSAMNGEGKSYVAINTAISLALLKKRVCLVGLDIRKPTLSNYLHIDFKGQLTSYLTDSSISFDDLVIPGGAVDGLDVIPSGIIPPNPGELIQSPRLADLFTELRSRYDYIVVDTAPISLVSDTFHLDKYADMTLFVSRANYLSRDFLPTIQEVYEQHKLHNMACVLNGVRGGASRYGYRYEYGYGYRYGYGARYGYGYGYYGQSKS